MRVTLVRQVATLREGRNRSLPDDPRLINDGLFGKCSRQPGRGKDVALDRRACTVARLVFCRQKSAVADNSRCNLIQRSHKDDAERRLGRALVLWCEWGLRVQMCRFTF